MVPAGRGSPGLQSLTNPCIPLLPSGLGCQGSFETHCACVPRVTQNFAFEQPAGADPNDLQVYNIKMVVCG